MSKKQKFSKHLKIVLEEMCRRVDIGFELVNFEDENWYQKHKWTEKEQDDFVKWLTDYLYANTEARQELTTVYYKNKKQLKKVATEFTFNYGWSFKKSREIIREEIEKFIRQKTRNIHRL